jgi:hypothetical protein
VKAPKPELTKKQSLLVAYLFDSKAHTLRAPLTEWVLASTRYATFLQKYKDKIRKKIRVTADRKAIADLLAELQIPYWLLLGKRFEVVYEPYLAAKTRGPDFAVTFRTNFTFNLEITQVHGLHLAPVVTRGVETPIDFRLVDVLCGKLRQLLPNMSNLILIAAPQQSFAQLDLAAHLAWIKDKAEVNDPLFYARQRFINTADFFKHYERLSGLILFNLATDQKNTLWLNPQARVKLTEQVKTALQRRLTA